MITSQIPDFNLGFAGLNNRRALVFKRGERMNKIRFITPSFRLVTLTSDIDNIKEIYSDDDLTSFLKLVNQNCPTRIMLRSVGKRKDSVEGILEDKE